MTRQGKYIAAAAAVVVSVAVTGPTMAQKMSAGESAGTVPSTETQQASPLADENSKPEPM